MAFKITNICGHIKVKGTLNLENLVLRHPEIKYSVKRLTKKKQDLEWNENKLLRRERTGKLFFKHINQKGFNSVVFSIPTSGKKVTGLCYPSGKILLVGADSEDILEEATIIACLILRKTLEGGIRISNIATTGTICRKLTTKELQSLSRTLAEECGSKYSVLHEPDSFPGMSVDMRNDKKRFRLFLSGIGNMVGSATEEEAKNFFNEMKQMVGKIIDKINE